MATEENEWPSLVRRRGETYPTGWIRVFRPGAANPSGRNIGTGHGRGVMGVGSEAIWVTNSASRTVTRLDRSLGVAAVARVRRIPIAIAVSPQATWILCRNGWLWRIPSGSESAEGVARLGPRARAVVATEAWIWVLRERGELVRIEPSTGEVTLQVSVGRGARHLIEGEGALWATRARGRKLLRIDPDSGEVVAESKPPRRVVCLTVDRGSVWIGCRRRSSAKKGWLYSSDAATLAWAGPQELSGRPRAIAGGLDAVWVACAARGERRGTIERFDPAAQSLETFAETDWPVYDLAVFSDQLLATMGLSVSSNFDAGTGPFDLASGGGGGGDGGGGGHHGG